MSYISLLPFMCTHTHIHTHRQGKMTWWIYFCKSFTFVYLQSIFDAVTRFQKQVLRVLLDTLWPQNKLIFLLIICEFHIYNFAASSWHFCGHSHSWREWWKTCVAWNWGWTRKFSYCFFFQTINEWLLMVYWIPHFQFFCAFL